MEKVFSIVTPSFNQGRFIERTINSIWSQSGDFYIQHIISDGGSNDNTVDIIKKYEKLLKKGEYPVKCKGVELVWWSEKDSGQSDAINKGFKNSTGDFIAWQNSDDTFNLGAFQKILFMFKNNPEIDLVFGDFNFINKKDKILQRVYHRPFSKWEFLYVSPNITNQSAFWRRGLLEKAGLLDENYHYGMDFEFFVRLSEFGKFKYLDAFLGNLRVHEDSKTVSVGEGEEWKREYAKIRKKYGIETDLMRDWAKQYRMEKAYFFCRRLFWYIANGQLDYLWRKFIGDPQVIFWRDKIKNTNIKKKIAILHPDFSLGGAGSVAIFMIEALKNEFEVHLITTEKVNLCKTNDFFGTDFNETDFKNIVVPKNQLISKIIKSAFLLKVALVQRYIKKEQEKFDLIIASRCEMELPHKRGIQYIHFPVINDEPLRNIGQMGKGIIQNDNFFRKIYYYIFWKVSNLNLSRINENITLVNSDWTGKICKKAYALNDYRVVYPPVSNSFPAINWKEKEKGFVCIGAVSALKKNIEIIKILEKVKKENPGIHLHIIGRSAGDKYSLIVEKMVKERDWVIWNKDINRKELEGLVAKHRFGIHGMENEHFGIAVSELVNSGCIPFIPNSGGQVEIVGDERLIYNSEKDAIEKINKILKNEDGQIKLVKKLSERKFTKNSFKEKILKIVKSVIG